MDFFRNTTPCITFMPVAKNDAATASCAILPVNDADKRI